jgi:hypothetical protein
MKMRVQENQKDHPQVPNQSDDEDEEELIKRLTCKYGLLVSPSRINSVTSFWFFITIIGESVDATQQREKMEENVNKLN